MHIPTSEEHYALAEHLHEREVAEEWKLYKETEEAEWYKNPNGEILSVPREHN